MLSIQCVLNHLYYCHWRMDSHFFFSSLFSSVENIAALAPSYINSNDVILTIGRSRTVEAFLKVWLIVQLYLSVKNCKLEIRKYYTCSYLYEVDEIRGIHGNKNSTGEKIWILVANANHSLHLLIGYSMLFAMCT